MEVTAALLAPRRPILAEGEHPPLLLFVPRRLDSGHRPHEHAVLVLVLGDRPRCPAVELAQRDTEPFGRLYSLSEFRRIAEAACEKGTETFRLFSDHALFQRTSNW